jgi:MYXO-CTERM domain-containing protein
MRKFLIRSAMVMALSIPVAALHAQTASQPNNNDTATTTTTDRHDDAGKWGLLGLLGLAGLLGLKRADRTDRAENYRTNTGTNTAGTVPTR